MASQIAEFQIEDLQGRPLRRVVRQVGAALEVKAGERAHLIRISSDVGGTLSESLAGAALVETFPIPEFLRRDRVQGERNADTDTAAPAELIDGWQHPTGQRPRTVAIVGLGPTSNHWHAANFHYVSGLPSIDEVWTVNKGARTLRADLTFVMDDLEGERRKAPGYLADLVAAEVPIITSTLDAAVLEHIPPMARDRFSEYPLLHVVDEVGRAIFHARGRRGLVPDGTAISDAEVRQLGLRNGYYFHNSIPYMLAYAFAIGVESVLLWGCDYTYPGTDIREDDRANCEFWVGFLRGQGVKVTVPEATTLLNARRQPWAYGFGARQPVLD